MYYEVQYHQDLKVNNDCIKVLSALYSGPKSIRQLGVDCKIALYSVTVALDVLRAKHLAIRTTRQDPSGTGRLFEAV